MRAIAASLEGNEGGEGGRIDEETAEGFALADDETLLRAEESGRVEERLRRGEGASEGKEAELLRKLRAEGEASLMDGRMDFVAARSSLGVPDTSRSRSFPCFPSKAT